MQIGIMGAGALGTFYSGLLAASGADTVLYVRRNSRNHIVVEKKQLEIRLPEEKRTVIALPTITDNIEDLRKCDFLLLCVKAYSTEDAARQASMAVNPDCIIVSFQNGWGNIDAIKNYFKKSRIAAGTTSEGAHLETPGIATHGGKGITSLSMLDTENTILEPLVSALNKAGIQTRISPDYMTLIWKKLIVNAVINPLTAINNVPNRYVGQILFLREIGKQIIKECVDCCKKEGTELSYTEMEAAVFSTAEKTGDNISSMLQDIRAGRKTEIDFISGAIENLGKKHGIDTKANSIMKNLVKAREEIK